MADTQSRLATLMEKAKKLEAQIAEEKAKEEAQKAISGIGANLANLIQQEAVKVGVDVKVLNGKFFALTVGEDGKLAVNLTNKANGHRATTTNTHKGNGNGNGQYEYYLKDGRGPFATIREAMDKMGIAKDKRPNHNRYDRLSKSWQEKIVQKAKATQPAS